MPEISIKFKESCNSVAYAWNSHYLRMNEKLHAPKWDEISVLRVLHQFVENGFNLNGWLARKFMVTRG
jgi:hypothetical protein